MQIYTTQMEKVHQNYVCTFMDNGFHENLNDKKNKIKKKKNIKNTRLGVGLCLNIAFPWRR